VQQWQVDRVTPIAPVDFATCDAAYLIRLKCGEEVTESVVEFAAPSSVASGGYAEEKLSSFFGDEEPPQHIVVEREGTVRIVTGPKPTDPNRAPRSAGPAEPRRARSRGRR
jgi:hypothetical protein